METKKLKARGLKALIPVKSRAKPKKKKTSVFYIEIRKIRQTREMLNKKINRQVLKELIDSIRKFGIIQPLIVIKIEKKKRGGGLNVYYRLVAGQKRLIAAKSAGLAVVPAIIKNDPFNRIQGHAESNRKHDKV